MTGSIVTARAMLVAVGLGFALAACDGSGEPGDVAASGGSDGAAEVAAAKLPAGLFVDTAPEGAVHVGAAKSSAAEGERIVLQGKIGGVVAPFVDGMAAVTVADLEAIVSCDAMEGDGCQTPWDYCCEEPRVITANTALVQVVGDDGRPLKVGLKGAGGLLELAHVVVKGRVAARPDPAVLIIEAESIHVVKATDKPDGE